MANSNRQWFGSGRISPFSSYSILFIPDHDQVFKKYIFNQLNHLTGIDLKHLRWNLLRRSPQFFVNGVKFLFQPKFFICLLAPTLFSTIVGYYYFCRHSSELLMCWMNLCNYLCLHLSTKSLPPRCLNPTKIPFCFPGGGFEAPACAD